jgi:hypothetical protein
MPLFIWHVGNGDECIILCHATTFSGLVQKVPFPGYTGYRQSRARRGFWRFECYPDLNHARESNGRARKIDGRKARQGSPKGAKEGILPSNMSAADTPLRIPFGNKELALQLGARYRAGGWYAPPGTDLTNFRRRGWL